MLLNIENLGLYNSILILIFIVISISIHEFTHSIIALIRGDISQKYNSRLTLNPFMHIDIVGFIFIILTGFGWGKPVLIDSSNFKNKRLDTILVAICGPLSNLIMGLVLFLLIKYLNFPINIKYILTICLIVNINLGIFNLLPIPPLDGSSMITNLLPNKYLIFLNKYSFQLIFLILFLAFIPIINNQSIISLIISPISNFIIQKLI